MRWSGCAGWCCDGTCCVGLGRGCCDCGPCWRRRVARPDSQSRVRLRFRCRCRVRCCFRLCRFATCLPYITFPFTIRNVIWIRCERSARFTVPLRTAVFPAALAAVRTSPMRTPVWMMTCGRKSKWPVNRNHRKNSSRAASLNEYRIGRFPCASSNPRSINASREVLTFRSPTPSHSRINRRDMEFEVSSNSSF